MITQTWDRFRRFMGWNKTSYAMFGVFLLTCGLIVYIWWPLAVEYLSLIDWDGNWLRQIDWLLIGIWLVMSLLIMRHADLRRDLPLIAICAMGGLVIEGWGTQTELWTYYTNERPPLWIIPAWPVAGLSIDRLVRLVDSRVTKDGSTWWQAAYWIIFPAFLALMLIFVWPTITQSLTILSLALCVVLILSPTDYRMAVITFLAGISLGYFLELWGTTRLCWTYYTEELPPFFAVLAHGMAGIAFWRVFMLAQSLFGGKTKTERGGETDIATV